MEIRENKIHLKKIKDCSWMGEIFEQHGFTKKDYSTRQFNVLEKAKIFSGQHFFEKDGQKLVFFQWTGDFPKNVTGIESIDVSNLI